MQVWEASEGLEALRRVRRDPVFDLLVVDVYMPTMDGLTFIREVKKVPGYEHTPIVIVTSDSSRERRLAGRILGISAWLLKPPNMEALAKSILAALYRTLSKKSADNGLESAGANRDAKG